MNIVTIECPNCGGKIERDNNGYFANCPFCGTEVCFDEIRGEAQTGEINELKGRVKSFEEKERLNSAGITKIKKWRRWRNLTYTGVFALTFSAFFLVGLSISINPETEALVGIGAVLFILLMMLFFAAPPALASYYPDYDIIEGKVSFHDRLVMYVKIAITSVGIATVSAFAAYAVLNAMGYA